jgi:hypothetical protein
MYNQNISDIYKLRQEEGDSLEEVYRNMVYYSKLSAISSQVFPTAPNSCPSRSNNSCISFFELALAACVEFLVAFGAGGTVIPSNRTREGPPKAALWRFPLGQAGSRATLTV